MNRSKTNAGVTLAMTGAVLIGVAILIFNHFAPMLGVAPSKYISPNDVRGIAVEHNNLLYTLNFTQQNALIDLINQAIQVGQGSGEQQNKDKQALPEIQKIVIYRFNSDNIEMIPIAYRTKTDSKSQQRSALIFSVPAWNPQGYLEISADELNKFLSSTYDP